jgi:D-glycero-D-manno-heptose 1,7-bisphosphate phosphatase
VSVARTAFVDRDGVVIELVPDPETWLPESPLRVEDVALIPGAAPALRRLRRAGWRVVGVSNQPAAAKGVVSVQQLDAIQARVRALLTAEDAHFDDFRICLHHPAGTVPELSRECGCRKPAPGMLLDAARELEIDLNCAWMIGDTDNDVQAGRAAGCRTVLIEHEPSAHKRSDCAQSDAQVRNLSEAVTLLLGEERVD